MPCIVTQCNGMTVKEKSLCFEYLISRNLHLTLYEIFSANIHFPIPIQNGEKWCSKVSSAIWHPESAIRNPEVSQIYFYLLWNHKTQPATLDTFYSHHHTYCTKLLQHNLNIQMKSIEVVLTPITLISTCQSVEMNFKSFDWPLLCIITSYLVHY